MPSSVDTVSIRHVTSNFFFWQGLRWVGPGLSLILVAAGLNASLPHEWKRPLLAFALLLGVAGTVVAGKYYRRSFGTARVDPAMHEERTLWKWAVVYPLMLVAMSADIVLRPPIIVSGIVFAAGIEMYRRSTGGGRRHYIVASALFAMYTPIKRLSRVNATLPSTKERMSAAGKSYEPVTYAGAGHAFMRMGESPDAEPANRRAHDDAWERWLKLLRSL